MENIVIFDTETDIKELVGKTDDDIFYDGLKKLAVFPNRHIDTFLEMKNLAQRYEPNDATIDSILLEQVLDFTIPILCELPNTTMLKKKTDPRLIKKENANITKNVIDNLKKSRSNISIKLRNDKLCSYMDEFVKIVKNATIETTGILVKKAFVGKVQLSPNEVINGLIGLYNFLLDDYNFYHNSIIPVIKPAQKHDDTFDIIEFDDKVVENLRLFKKMLFLLKTINDRSIYYTYARVALAPAAASAHTPGAVKKPEVSAEFLEKLISRKLTAPLAFQTIMAIHNYGHLHVYNKLLVKHDKEIEEELKTKTRFETLMDTLNFQKFKNQIQIFQKKNIALGKFNKSDLFTLTPNELKEVEKEFAKLSDARGSSENIALVYALVESIDSGANIKPALDAVIAASKGQKNGFLLDKKGHSLVCAHITEKATLLLNERQNIVERLINAQNDMIKKFGVMEDGAYYCQFCGEKLNNAAEDDLGIASREGYSFDENYRDKLYSNIYNEALYIFSSYVDFLSLSAFNISVLLNNITDLIKPEIRKIEADLLQIKTSQKENITLTLNVYINIYIFAAVAQLIYTNQNLLRFKEYRVVRSKESPFIMTSADAAGGKEARSATKKAATATKTPAKKASAKKASAKAPAKASAKKAPVKKAPAKKTSAKTTPVKEEAASALKELARDTIKNRDTLQKIINTALNILKRIKKMEIKMSDFMTEDSIKNIFLKAYKTIINYKYVSISRIKDTLFIQNNLVEYLIYAFNKTSRDVIAPPFTYFIASAYTDISHHYKNIDQLLGRSYDQLRDDLIKQNKSMYDTIVVPKKWTESDYHFKSFEMIIHYLRDGLFLENVSDSEKLDEFYAKYSDVLRMSKDLRLNRKRTKLLPLKKIGYMKSGFNIKPDALCVEFEPVYQKLNKNGQPVGAKKTFTRDEINGWLMSGDAKKAAEFKEWHVVEKRCVKHRLNKKSDNKSEFYRMYESACPVGQIHVFEGAQCSLCGITYEKIENMDGAYYEKYKGKFDKLRAKIKESRVADDRFAVPGKVRHGAPGKSEKGKPEGKKPAKYDYDESEIREFIRLVEIDENEFINLGFYESKQYNEVKKSRIILLNISNERLKARNNSLYAYHIYIARSYYMLKNSEFLLKYPDIVRSFLDKYSNEGFNKKLPVIESDFIDKFKSFKKTLPPADLSRFVLYSITKLLMEIYEIFKKNKQQAAGLYFIKTVIARVFESEQKLTDFTVKKTRQTESMEEEVPAGIAELDEDNADQPEDAGDAQEDDEDDEGVDNFGLEEFDADNDFADDPDGADNLENSALD